MSLLLNRRTVVLSMAAMVAAPRLSMAETTVHEIAMLNRHPDDRKRTMVFDPLIVVGEPGDTFRFLSVDKGHNTVSAKGMIPEGAEPWKSKINADFDVTLEKPGFYGYVCQPHTAMGMVGLIIVQGDGMMDNLEAAKAVRQRGRSKKVWEEIWVQVDSGTLFPHSRNRNRKRLR